MVNLLNVSQVCMTPCGQSALFLKVLGMMLGELDGSSQTPAKSKPVRLYAVRKYCYMAGAAHVPQALNQSLAACYQVAGAS